MSISDLSEFNFQPLVAILHFSPKKNQVTSPLLLIPFLNQDKLKAFQNKAFSLTLRSFSEMQVTQIFRLFSGFFFLRWFHTQINPTLTMHSLLSPYCYILAYSLKHFISLFVKCQSRKWYRSSKLIGIYNGIVLNSWGLNGTSVYIQLANRPAILWKHSNTWQAMLYSPKAMEGHQTWWTSFSTLGKLMPSNGC